MAISNSFLTNEHTAMLQKLVREVVSDPKLFLGVQYIPSVAMPVRKIRTEVIEANGGLTAEHMIGQDVKNIQGFGSRVQEFEPPAYREAIQYDEERILYLRELGQNDPSKRGIRQYIDQDVDRLNRRLEVRMEQLRWNAIFNGGFSYFGKTLSYGIPSGNKAIPSILWSLDGINANPAANPLTDIRFWVMGGKNEFRKYKINKMVMNPNTARWILDNANTRSYLSSYGANPALNGYDVNTVLALLIPGCPPVEIYEGWYQTESLTGSKLVVSNAIYFIPDGAIYLQANLPGGDKIGEFVQGINIQNGTIENPGFGKFLVIEDNTAPGTKGGTTNPYLNLVAGVNGGVKLDRPFDVLTAQVS